MIITIKCTFCNRDIDREKRFFDYEVRKNPNYKPFCCKKCLVDYKYSVGLAKEKHIVNCFNCNKQIEKSDSDFNKSDKYFCSLKCRTIFCNKERTENGYSTLNSKKEYKCIKCGKNELGSIHCNINTFCCLSCKEKHATEVAEKRKNKPSNCISCDKEIYGVRVYCDDCLKIHQQQAGCKSAATRKDVKRSKNEILLGKLCQEKYVNVTFNDPIFDGWDADILLHDYKIAVHWNGPWHYQYCGGKHSLAQVQSRDKIKHSSIEKKGWTNYIIQDMGKYKSRTVREEFEKLNKYIDTI